MVKRKSDSDTAAEAAPPRPGKAAAKVPGKASAKPAAEAEGKAPSFGKKELLAELATDLDLSKKDLRQAMDAVLGALGAALARGDSLNLPPLGKARVARSKGEGVALSLTIKLRAAGVKNPAKGRKEPLAEGGEDG